MTRYWVVGLIVAVVVLLFAARRVTRRPDADQDRHALVPHGDGERADAFAGVDLDDSGDLDDTSPAVLSPPEWRAPHSASNGSRH
jgi:hypothetical protein